MIGNLWLHPTLFYIIGALLLPFIPKGLRKTYLVLVPCLAFCAVLSMIGNQGVYGVIHYLGGSVIFGRVDALSLVFAHIMTLMCIIGTIFGLHVERNADHIAAWLYVAGSLGVIFCADYLTLFLFWEMMAFSSVFLIWLRGRKQSLRAGYRYLLVHVAGGLFLLAGIILRYKATGSLAFDAVGVDQPTLSTYLIMIGFILNAAVPPLHAWLPDAYAEATVTGAVFMCAFTTKTAVYALCRGFAGMEILVPLGVCMALYGVVYAVLENDIRKLLAYHIISQVGYMVAGVGIGTAMAINGTCAHAFAHILYKGLLFMGCGSVLHMTGKSNFTELGGLYDKMPKTFVYTLIGGLAISAFPLFSGFVSKSMIVAAGMEDHYTTAAFLLLVASAGTFLHTGLKVPYYIWFGKDNCSRETRELAQDPPRNMQLGMAIAAFFCIFIGCYTPYLYSMLPFQEAAAAYKPYTAPHIFETLQILLFTALGFFLLLKKLTPEATISLDMDWFYRKGALCFMRFASGPISKVNDWIGEVYRTIGLAWTMATAKALSWFDREGIDFVVDGSAKNVLRAGDNLRNVQTGKIQQYIGLAAICLFGILIVVILL